MEDKFEFSKVGKKMPYEVPDGFFERLENRVMEKIQEGTEQQKRKSHKNTKLIFFTALVATAAAIALLIIPQWSHQPSHNTEASYANVEKAFDNLSDADCDYLLETYQDDLFLN